MGYYLICNFKRIILFYGWDKVRVGRLKEVFVISLLGIVLLCIERVVEVGLVGFVVGLDVRCERKKGV